MRKKRGIQSENAFQNLSFAFVSNWKTWTNINLFLRNAIIVYNCIIQRPGLSEYASYSAFLFLSRTYLQLLCQTISLNSPKNILRIKMFSCITHKRLYSIFNLLYFESWLYFFQMNMFAHILICTDHHAFCFIFVPHPISSSS